MAGSQSRLPTGVRWLLLAAGIVSFGWAWQNRLPDATSDFTLFYDSAAQPTARMYAPPAGRPRGNMNPPAFQLVTKPLTLLPLHRAAQLWLALNLLSLMACLWWLSRLADEPWDVGDVGVLLAWAPMQSALSLNQVTWVLWPLLLGAWLCLRKKHCAAGAVAFGVVLALKAFLGVFLLWLAVRRQWRTLAISLASAAVVTLAGVIAFGAATTLSWVHSLRDVAWWSASMNASFRGIFVRALTVEGDATAPLVIAPSLVGPLSVACGAIVIIVTLIRTRSRDVEHAWAPLMAASLLASPLGWLYYMWWVLPPNRRPTRLLFESPLLWLPMVLTNYGRSGPWAMLSIGSIYFWGTLAVWISTLSSRSSPGVR